MAAAPSALLLLPPFPVLSTYRLQSRSRPSAPETDDSRVGGIMRGEKNYYFRGAAGDHGSCPTTTSPLASALLMPSEAVSSSWSESGGGLSGGDEEDTRLLQLLRTARDPSEAFQALQAALPRRGGRLGFPRRKEALYRALGRVLVEGGSDEKRLCLQLLSDVLRGQGEAGQLEEAFSLALLPQLVVSLREENPALRKDALQILHICLKRSPGEVLRTLIQQGLESTDARLRASTALLLPILLTTEDLLLGLDLTEVIISLARKLGDQETEEESETAFSALQQIGERLGQDRFQSYISRLPSALRRHYNRRLESQFGSQVPYYLELEASGFPEDPLPCAVTLSNSNLKFGIIPQELHSRLLDQEDYKNRTQAVEELKQVLGKFNPSSTPHSSLVGFISLLYNLLDDSNFKVVHGTLEVLHLLVIRLGEQVQQFLGPVIAASVKVLADNKLVIKQEYMKIFLKLMKEVGPQQVLCLLLEHLKHKHSRVREEVVNICICSLLTYPSEDFDLPKLSFDLAPALVDSKRRVRQAALEAFAVLASSMGSGKTSILFKAVDTVELQDNGDGVMNAVQARLARKTLPRLTEQGFVEYAVLMPSSAGGRSNHLAHGADTDWLLAGNRTQSAHCHCGDHVRDSMHIYGSYSPTICTRRVLSAGKGKNKLPWENEQPGIMGENQTSTSKDIEQFSTYDFIPSAKLKLSQGMPVNDDLCFSRKRVSRNLFQNSRDFNPDCLPLCAAGTTGTHQTNLSGKCAQLGFSQICGKTGSVGSDLQFLGTTSSHQEKVYASLNFGSKTQQTFGSQTECTSSNGQNPSPGAYILPSYPVSSPRTSPKHTSPLIISPKKSQDNSVNFSNSWPLKSFEGLSKPSPQKKLVSQKSSDPTGRNHGENSQEKPPVQLTPALVRSPSSRRGLNGTKPVPPIPRGISLLPDKADLSTVGHKKKEPDDIWKCEKDSLPIDLSELNFKDKDLDQEEMHSSLRSLRNSAAKKRAKLSGSTSDLESPDSAMKLDLTMDSPSLSSSPNINSYSESGVYSQESLTSSLSTTPQGKRIMSDIFPTFGSKPCPTRLSSAKKKISHIAEQSPSAGSSSNPQQISSFDFTTTKALSEDSVVVVGKGVFGSLSSAPATCSQSVISSVENGDTFSIKQSIEPPSGIYGRSVQQNISSYLDVENEKDAKVSISKSTYNKMRQKRKEEKELFHNKDCEKKEKNSWERMRHTGTEKMASESETPTGAISQYKERMPSVTHSPEIMDLSELRPFSKPEIALTEALRLLADEDWEKKIEGLNFIRCLAAFHSEILNTKLHETNFAVVQEVKNLRSGVSRAAVVCLSDLFTYLKKSMDQELDTTVKVLLHKAGESNTFIREDVDKALRAMVNNVTPARAVVSLINGGQRYYGRKMLFFMMCHPNFEKMLEKYVPSKDLPYIKDSVRNLQQKGLGEIPLDTPSAKGRRSHTGSVGNTRSSSVSRDAFNSAERAVTEVREVTRKSVPRNSLESAEYLKLITGLLNAKDFRDRINGIKQLLSDTENNQDLVVGNIVKIFDAFKSRLHDSNSKVNLVALETMHKMIPLLRDHLSPIINMLIPAIVDNNLNSKNPGIYAAATNVVQALSQHVDNYLLLQPFCTKAQFLNGKAKQDMTEKLADIVTELYQRKPHATEQKVLVVLWHLLGNMTNSGSLPGAGGNIRTATAKLSKALFAQMGQNLLNQAASQPPHIKKSLEELLDMTILNEL
ncbi:TOG array regulator of axonemal microtubules 1 [Homo sapiens]|uniref:TOG array regulator of axonemal microtubules protein 1 n=1 Tax=Homo sapiens TaxID=9606 RepID=TGRM1_HUMAN|nr:TOG array regulator of axonemal microtubules protein 1 isoform 2 [Homo sapiens]Q9Y4F4.4 RecName: Full=TOG array regulator of axonemal microtubules protein 1; AltName: Full=Crescerin-1; AltName: Full=Protein FAM179B [Homo sapiens]EAW65791.1 KIAA0423, isoform CRA_b [Homo sapiens]KAI2571096.1 TOG array regulator of axonemal microtubules 1 [Homo sapiens]KAI4060728.1 TOG array regulator of axonemal microtubules 1 [Homo sapiens]|eukprot:NP_055906.2 TOG array regulator of axonemal microtubules protein 1 isoform 2 [Homo sapiens]